MYEYDLKGSSAFGKDGTGGVSDFKVFGYGVHVCEDDGTMARTMWIDDDGERVDWATVAGDGGGWGVYGAEGVFDVGEVNPDGVVGEAFVV